MPGVKKGAIRCISAHAKLCQRTIHLSSLMSVDAIVVFVYFWIPQNLTTELKLGLNFSSAFLKDRCILPMLCYIWFVGLSFGILSAQLTARDAVFS
jgi:hypothetical protein